MRIVLNNKDKIAGGAVAGYGHLWGSGDLKHDAREYQGDEGNDLAQPELRHIAQNHGDPARSAGH